MAFTLPPLNLSGGAGGAVGPLDAASQVGTPVNVSFPWNQNKNYQNHTEGSSQSATATANPSAGGSSLGGVGGVDMKWILIGAAVWLLLRRQ
jgi:hypothetical protein